MRLLTFSALVLCASLPVTAKSKPEPAPAKAADQKVTKEHPASPASAQPAAADNAAKPAPAPTPAAAPATPPPVQSPKSSASLDSYLSALNDELALSKDEQTDIKTYYQEDGAKLHAILNNASLSPIDQERQTDDLRNAKIEALLKDVDRQAKFLEFENSHRVELVELAAGGGLTPKAPLPNVPQPTSTPPAQADKTTPGV